jgi:predicted transcriptional regulator
MHLDSFTEILIIFAFRDLRITNNVLSLLSETILFAMKKHNGMRPHDIAILLKIASKGDTPWQMKTLAQELGISNSEVSESIHRSVFARLIAQDKKTLMRTAIISFLEHGLPYVYPQQPGPLVRGIATAHAAPPLDSEIMSNDKYVWPYYEGNVRGQAIEPLHPKVPEACLYDPVFYELMALCDALRVGKSREKILAVEALKARIL